MGELPTEELFPVGAAFVVVEERGMLAWTPGDEVNGQRWLPAGTLVSVRRLGPRSGLYVLAAATGEHETSHMWLRSSTWRVV